MAAKGLNKWQGIGRTGKDVELRYTAKGTPVGATSLACNEQKKNPTTGEYEDSTFWMNLVIWDKLAEIFSEYVPKGQQIYVEGRLQTNKWTDQNGVDRYTTECVVSDMILLGSKGDGAGSRPPHPADNDAPRSTGKPMPAAPKTTGKPAVEEKEETPF